MAKNNDLAKLASIEIGDFGKVQISDDVIATIAGLSAAEVEGVASMYGKVKNKTAAKVGIKNLTKGIAIEVQGRDVLVKLNLTLRYGYSVPKTTSEVQEKVKNALENMTGLNVKAVDIRIAGINLEKK